MSVCHNVFKMFFWVNVLAFTNFKSINLLFFFFKCISCFTLRYALNMSRVCSASLRSRSWFRGQRLASHALRTPSSGCSAAQTCLCCSCAVFVSVLLCGSLLQWTLVRLLTPKRCRTDLKTYTELRNGRDKQTDRVVDLCNKLVTQNSQQTHLLTLIVIQKH